MLWVLQSKLRVPGHPRIHPSYATGATMTVLTIDKIIMYKYSKELSMTVWESIYGQCTHSSVY